MGMIPAEQIEAELNEIRMDAAETRGYLRRLDAWVDIAGRAFDLLARCEGYEFSDQPTLHVEIAGILDEIEEYGNG
jgi:hypothetical protein